jgi:hypothetical protein
LKARWEVAETIMTTTATYYTFLRSCRNWQEFASADKVTQETGLTYSEAREACEQFNANLTEAQKEAGTRMEFTSED